MSDQQQSTDPQLPAAPEPEEQKKQRKPRKPRPPRSEEEIALAKRKRLDYLCEKQKARMQKRLTDLEAHRALVAAIKKLIAEFEAEHGASEVSSALAAATSSPSEGSPSE